MKVASKAMDIARERGAAEMEMLDKAVELQEKNHGSGGNGLGQSADTGGRIDVTG
ncbi:hypothetical protein ACERK3_16385 [Phycisphaerales bacterium AB-hyl4]|uniref:Uncharacterized protein n=1 Tax=Natronomicrosphaera hydrolytica TaxID=3242702 RepID=A0ABV4UAI0_9BACT